MPNGGTLTLRCRLDFTLDGGPAIEVAIQDTGSGILPEHRARLFEPFFTTKSTGTGLGLPLVKRVVEAHRGHIAVTSSAAGTTVTVHVPVPVEDQSQVTLKQGSRSIPHLRVVGTVR
jgi:signal transduction histidine kinase